MKVLDALEEYKHLHDSNGAYGLPEGMSLSELTQLQNLYSVEIHGDDLIQFMAACYKLGFVKGWESKNVEYRK